MDEIEKLLQAYPVTREIHRFATANAAQSQVSAGIKYKTQLNNRHDIRFTYYSGVLILRGHGTYTTASGRCIRIGPGDFFQRFPMMLHSTTVDPGERWVEVFLDLPAALFSALALCGMADSDRPVLHPGLDIQWLRECLKLVDDLEASDAMNLPSIQSRIILLLERLLSMDRRVSMTALEKQLEIARELLVTPGERRSAEQIAQHVNLGYESFRKLFRMRYGISPNRYRISQRIYTAQDYLLGTGSVRETAAMLGYCDEFAFSKQFRQYTGVSPLEYIRMSKDTINMTNMIREQEEDKRFE